MCAGVFYFKTQEMKTRKYILLFICFILAGTVSASDFRFNAAGKFKIMQVTDTHIAGGSHSQVTIDMLNQVLDAEKPDLVIFTGDIVTGKPYKAGFEMVIEPLINRKIPYALVFGNHDYEQDLSYEELAGLLEKCPYNVSKLKKIKGVSGYGNYELEIKDRNGKKAAAVLYCMDSHNYSTLKQVKGYGWFAFDQVDRYRKLSEKYTSANGAKPLPALAFFHIPLLEYHEGYTDTNNKMIGTQMEKACAPEINTGMFAAMLEMGDVMGTFVGHDHDNDYIFNLYGIALAYGRFSGSKNTYTNLKNGVRLIELTEGERSFDTWIRLDDTTVINHVKYPDEVPVKQQKK